MSRFVARALLVSLAATVAWWMTADWTCIATVTGAKWLHRLAGYPAPHLLADLDDFYWFAPLFPPFVGLTLASTWLTFRSRLTGIAIGLAAFWYLVSLQIAITYSPYLTLSSTRAYTLSMLVALNTIVVPVVFWLLATGGPPSAGVSRRAGDPNARESRKTAFVVVGTLVFSVAVTLVVPLTASQSTPSLNQARRAAGRLIAAGDSPRAIEAVDHMLAIQRTNAALSYLKLHLLRLAGDEIGARRLESDALTSEKRRRAFREKFKFQR